MRPRASQLALAIATMTPHLNLSTDVLPSSFDKYGRTLVAVTNQLLRWCDSQSRQFHADMNNPLARFTKNRVRTWLRQYLAQTHISKACVDPQTIDLFDYLLRNNLPLADLSLQLDDLLDDIEKSNNVRLVAGSHDELPLKAALLIDGLPLDAPLPCQPVTIARAIAQAIDDALGPTIEAAFRAHWQEAALQQLTDPFQSTLEIPLKRGDLFPTILPNVRPFYPDPTFKLARSDDLPGQLTHVKMLTADTTVNLSLVLNELLEHDLAQVTSPIAGRLRVGFACLGSKDERDYDINEKDGPYPFSEWLNERLLEDPKADALGSFFGVSYRDGKRLCSILETANSNDVNILIYPELAFNENSVRIVRERYSALARDGTPLNVVILGSQHIALPTATSEGGTVVERRNRLTIATSTQSRDPNLTHTEFTHDKIGTFSYVDNKTQICHIEGIQRSRDLRALLVQGSVVCFLICKDILQASVLDALLLLSPRRLIVVAMSDRTDDFAYHLAELAARCNTISFLCCYAPTHEVTVGIFGPGKQVTALLLRNAAPGLANGSPQPPFLLPRSLSVEHPQPVLAPSLAWIDMPLPRQERDAGDRGSPFIVDPIQIRPVP